MGHYKVEVTRDGRWWMINVPEIDQLTQARRIDEIDEMARSLIAISTGEPIEEISISVSIDVPGMGDITRSAEEIVHKRYVATDVMYHAQEAAARFVRDLTAAGIPVRDVGELLGLSPQRISQLSKSK
ncbi:hypothetical protein DSM43518_04790 [Mycobacterium marinum]|uniref:HicB family toxin-antitoxin system n=1 Tax=Mycobacterium marinum TaxID=1781 RepID=UPI000CD969BD|nr:HicB family toxin-antitoxin system [Mycobacterium marinum]AXN51248.1 hypothetical protein CCUG20998_03852 [Mycobacterium marinum]RFZ02803.1 hypothetical protein DSM43518_04790 [Mycobacterium marinum]RFZ25994.1 hypothetical protein DSM43519_01308 [Mycobacterium marinum]RFZ28873.1 hypothetical protein DSM44344_01140 [Mycobacterium marinum]RFZ39059.1 hypothetical protein NCTC2275_00327 [Mycobacterium marinum]